MVKLLTLHFHKIVRSCQNSYLEAEQTILEQNGLVELPNIRSDCERKPKIPGNFLIEKSPWCAQYRWKKRSCNFLGSDTLIYNIAVLCCSSCDSIVPVYNFRVIVTLTKMRQLQQYTRAIELIGLICKAWKDQTQQPKAIDTGRKFMWLSSLADNQ